MIHRKSLLGKFLAAKETLLLITRINIRPGPFCLLVAHLPVELDSFAFGWQRIYALADCFAHNAFKRIYARAIDPFKLVESVPRRIIQDKCPDLLFIQQGHFLPLLYSYGILSLPLAE